MSGPNTLACHKYCKFLRIDRSLSAPAAALEHGQPDEPERNGKMGSILCQRPFGFRNSNFRSNVFVSTSPSTRSILFHSSLSENNDDCTKEWKKLVKEFGRQNSQPMGWTPRPGPRAIIVVINRGKGKGSDRSEQSEGRVIEEGRSGKRKRKKEEEVEMIRDRGEE